MLEQGLNASAAVLDRTIRGTNMYGLDLVMAISQSSINNQLRSRFLAARDALHRWNPGPEEPVIEIKGVSVIILSRSRAVVTIHVSEAVLTSKILDDKMDLVDEYV